MRWRLRSVRTRILLLVLVPVLSLVGTYAFAVSITARDAVNLANANAVKNTVGDPIAAFMAQLSTERMLAIGYMSDTTGANLAKLELQETKTNTAIAGMHSALTSSATTSNASPAEKVAIATLLRDAAGLPSLRAQVAAQIIPSGRAFDEYNALYQDAIHVLGGAIRQQTDATLVSQALAFVRMGQSGDLLSQENTLLLAGLTSGRFNAADLQAVHPARRGPPGVLQPDPPRPRPPLPRLLHPRGQPAGPRARWGCWRDTVIDGTRPGTVPPVSPLAWGQAVGAVGAGFTTAGSGRERAHEPGQQPVQRDVPQADPGRRRWAWSRSSSLIGLGLWIGRRLVRELSALRLSALELANERLPDVVARLAAGEEVDVSAQARPSPPAPAPTRSARSARPSPRCSGRPWRRPSGRPGSAQGISDIFRNLARRSQSLLHRQLALLDAMERRARDPQELEDLFRVDHLDHPHAAARREPDHLVRRGARARLAQPGAAGGRAPGRGRRGGGLHPDQGRRRPRRPRWPGPRSATSST